MLTMEQDRAERQENDGQGSSNDNDDGDYGIGAVAANEAHTDEEE